MKKMTSKAMVAANGGRVPDWVFGIPVVGPIAALIVVNRNKVAANGVIW